MRKLALVIAGLAMPAISSQATTPPPPPINFVASWKAIDDVEFLVGEWHGTEIQHVKNSGDYPQLVYWRITRLGGQDVLLLEHGHESSTPLSGRLSDKPRADEFDVLTYSPIEKGYKIYLPGYRLFRENESTGQLLNASRPDAFSLSWASLMSAGKRRQTSISIRGGKLIESVDEVGPDGAMDHKIDAELSKRG